MFFVSDPVYRYPGRHLALKGRKGVIMQQRRLSVLQTRHLAPQRRHLAPVEQRGRHLVPERKKRALELLDLQLGK